MTVPAETWHGSRTVKTISVWTSLSGFTAATVCSCLLVTLSGLTFVFSNWKSCCIRLRSGDFLDHWRLFLFFAFISQRTYSIGSHTSSYHNIASAIFDRSCGLLWITRNSFLSPYCYHHSHTSLSWFHLSKKNHTVACEAFLNVAFLFLNVPMVFTMLRTPCIHTHEDVTWRFCQWYSYLLKTLSTSVDAVKVLQDSTVTHFVCSSRPVAELPLHQTEVLSCRFLLFCCWV